MTDTKGATRIQNELKSFFWPTNRGAKGCAPYATIARPKMVSVVSQACTLSIHVIGATDLESHTIIIG